ncbi:hypothetical protein [Planctomicrobium piriforme]|uniref:Uncharacterized protein n=1 Tax=Planctomicrobium piriforme TaxID=1576369 RepID=A0A1I3EIY6_9PLAN|nr:hypothetical protein [Planctomicrobium piriforme]SFH98858.1 hypothetical protein SAMN05421753_104241 [Planctomicrobium piriforme]
MHEHTDQKHNAVNESDAMNMLDDAKRYIAESGGQIVSVEVTIIRRTLIGEAPVLSQATLRLPRGSMAEI